MANITNAQAARFADERARTIADLIWSLDRTLSQFMLDVVRDWESVPEVAAAQNTDVIVSSQPDSRNPVTKYNVGELKYVCEQLIACMATDDRRAIVNRWQVNGKPIF